MMAEVMAVVREMIVVSSQTLNSDKMHNHIANLFKPTASDIIIDLNYMHTCMPK